MQRNAMLAFCRFSGILLLLISSSFSSKQKVFLVLKEPLRDDNSVVVRLSNQMEENIELEEQPETQNFENFPGFNIVFQKSRNHSKQRIMVELPQDGMVKLEVFDFYGRRLGSFYNGYHGSGVLVLDEDETWKFFNQFHGVAYFTLSLDDIVVSRKLVAKME